MSEDLEKQIKEHFKIIIPKLAKSLYNDYEKLEYELQSSNIFAVSSSYFVYLKLWLKGNDKSDNEKNVKNLRFFAKTAIASELLKTVTKLDMQFHNEITFYRKYAKDEDCYPKCIYIEESMPYAATLILENVVDRGYSSHPKRIDLPLNDVLVAMKEIARFHAKGYIMKEKNPKKFSTMLNEIKDCRYSSYDNKDHFMDLLNLTIRAVNYLKKINYDRKFCEITEKLFKDTYHNVLLKAIVPVEPLAVLCHGDFTVNNVLFKKDENDTETRAMLIDFALLRYASPAIDLSTFLCLSCSREDRNLNLSKIMRTYHEELINCLKKADMDNLERFSYDAIWKEFVDHGLFGFVIASFFLHILMGTLDMQIEELLQLDKEEFIRINIESGGDEVSKILADMLIDLDKLGCLNKFL